MASATSEDPGSRDNVVRSRLPAVDLPLLPLTEYVLGGVARRATRASFVDGVTGRVLTFGDLAESIHSLAGGLSAAGFGRGDVLALMAPNMPDYPAVFHAAAVAGGSVTPINPSYTATEIRNQLAHSRASFFVATRSNLSLAKEALRDTHVRRLFVIDRDDGADSINLLHGTPIGQVPVDPTTDIVALPYSSGTTGRPKGVMLSHQNLAANIAQAQAVQPCGESDVMLAVLPFFHIYGLQMLMNGPLANGCTVVTLPQFNLRRALELIETWHVSQFFVVPPIVSALANDPAVQEFDLSSLTLVNSGGAPLGPSLAQQATERIGCQVVQGYGMTELSPATHMTPAGDFQPGSVGITLPNIECRIVSNGIDMPVGEEGELWMRGPMVMQGYLDDPQATSAMVDGDGWLRTGDIGRFDRSGHLYIVDRLKELIKVNAFQVAPAELEAVLLSHPSISDAAVVGVPDDVSGETPVAFVVLEPDHPELSEEDVVSYVASRVATYKKIRTVKFLDVIPKSASGKILRRLLTQANEATASDQ